MLWQQSGGMRILWRGERFMCPLEYALRGWSKRPCVS